MADQRLEAIGLAVDPVDHVAAVARAQRGHALAVEPRVLRQRRVEAHHQIAVRRAAPVVADRVGEGLAVAGRAVEVDEHHAVAAARIGLRVPPVVEVIAEAALGAAVDEERDRVLLARDPARRLHHVAVHGVALVTLERELLVVAPRERLHARVVQVRHLAQVAAVGADREELGRHLQRVAQEEHAIAGDARLGVVALGDDGGDLAGGGVDGEERVVAHVVGRRVDRLAVLAPGQAARRAVPRLGQRVRLARAQVVDDDALAVGLVARARHRRHRDRLAVGRERGREVVGLVGHGQVHRLATAAGLDEEHVRVGGPREVARAHAGHVRQRLAVG